MKRTTGTGLAVAIIVLAAVVLTVWHGVPQAAASEPPLFDAQLQYGTTGASELPAAEVVEFLEKARIGRALISVGREAELGALLAAGPGLVAPSLRPYRTRSELATWIHDAGTPARLAERLGRHPYVALGKLHLYGAQVDLPVVRAILALARRRDLLLHVQGDGEAIDRIFDWWPRARVLWAHAGFAPATQLQAMLSRHRRLWCDLARRSDIVSGDQVSVEWRALFEAHPDRFMAGSDAERWQDVELHAAWNRLWLAGLPDDIARRIGWTNGVRLLEQLAVPRRVDER